jgi:hypothetical protein
MTISQRFRRSFRPLVAAAVAATAFLAPSALAQEQKMLDTLNAPWQRVQASSQSWKPILTALLDATEAPKKVTASFDPGSIWPGSTATDPAGAWADWSAWAEKNAGLAKVVLEQRNQAAFAMPYGEDKVDASFRAKGWTIVVDLDADGRKTTLGYLDAIALLNSFVVADMYRNAEAGKFQEAFTLGVAHLQVLRQIADQQMLGEKLFALRSIDAMAEVHRDILFTYRDKIPVDVLRTLGTRDYPLIRPQDGERLRRLEMPEGDRYVAEAILARVFDDRGQPNPTLFAEVFAGIQAANAPLTRFGAARRWQAIAALHGSLDASQIKLTQVYDDWWRRWRIRWYDPALSASTELSLLNPIRYAAITLAVLDINDAFLARRRAATSLNSLATVAALVSYQRANGAYPDDIEKVFPVHGQKRYNLDPYEKAGNPFVYRFLGSSSRTVQTPDGPVTFTGALLYARAENNEDDGAARHDPTGLSHDLVLWPPLRALQRGVQPGAN